MNDKKRRKEMCERELNTRRDVQENKIAIQIK
jgi:hypothetical protein